MLDHAADSIAPQHGAPAASVRRPHFTAWARPPVGLVVRLLRGWTEGWKWYAASGYTPPAGEPAFPLRQAARLAQPSPRITLAACGCTPRFALLFGPAAASR